MTKPRLKHCANCGKNINQKSRVCPFCAGEAFDPVTRDHASCPRCGVRLTTEKTEYQEVYERCSRCEGLWLDPAGFHRVTRRARRDEGGRYQGKYLRGPLRNPPNYLSCVRCGKKMNRKNFSKISGIIIDECRGHGIWLDTGELEKIEHFIADGGLDRARDREIEHLRLELTGLATKVDRVAFSHKLIHFFNAKRWLFTGWR